MIDQSGTTNSSSLITFPAQCSLVPSIGRTLAAVSFSPKL